MFFSEVMRSTAYIFGMKQCLVAGYTNTANRAPWSQTGREIKEFPDL